MNSSTDFQALLAEAIALAAAHPDPSRHIQVSQAQYNALLIKGAKFYKNTPNVDRKTMTKTVTYQGRHFFVVVRL